MELPIPYLNRIKEQTGGTFAAYLAAMGEPPRRALRVNPLKITEADFLARCDFSLTETGALPGSFFFPEETPIGRHPLHLSGLCYVQEPAAMMPVTLLGVVPGMRVLDLCAAPGGKSGQIGALLEGEGLLVSNEPLRQRAEILRSNLERLGIVNALVTTLYPDALAKALPAYFDAVLVDAPCSGEGMFRKEPGALRDWSESAVAACAARQKGILHAAAGMLKPGGTLVYATCTFSTEEDEGQVRDFLNNHPSFTCTHMEKLYPHTFPGEGQFMARLVKDGALDQNSIPVPLKPVQAKTLDPALEPWRQFCRDYLDEVCFCTERLLPDGRVVLLPPGYTAALGGLRILGGGIQAGEMKGRLFVPGHGLAMAWPRVQFKQAVALTEQTFPRYLAGETIPVPKAQTGWCAATVDGVPIGIGKAVEGQLKNHLPKGLRFNR